MGAIITLIIVAVIGLVVYVGVQDSKKWESFKKEHHCEVIATERGGTALTSDGKAVFMPDKTTWECNDGKTYTRES